MPLTMPPEWVEHDRMWMSWPTHEGTVEAIGGPEVAERAWATVARAVAEFEPVTVVVNPDQAARARRQLGPEIAIMECPVGDGWMRDSGPTFVTDEIGALVAIDWTFNGWGGRTFPEAVDDALIARRVAEAAGARRVASHLVNEGGGIHVDGEGTLLLTETVQLNPNRNPSWTRAEIEAEFADKLGTSKTIWLPRGVEADTGCYGTDGHVDTLACFVRPGCVVVHGQPDPEHPDHETAVEIEAIMRAETDAKGRPLEVVVIDAPPERYDAEGGALSCSYINFVFANGGIVLPTFGDRQDERAAEILAGLCPGRRVVPVDAIPIFMGGGGVHCITQQQPRVPVGA